MNCISTSIFDIFKIGPGPSSSHTIGPMRAGADFLARLAELPAGKLEQAHHIEVELFGSLALTGKGHGTDRAAAAGLLGELPETCNVERLASLFSDPAEIHTASFAGKTAFFTKKSVHFNTGKHDHPYSNTLTFRLFSETGELLAEETYYSVGGGFIQREGEPPKEMNAVPHRYKNWESFRRLIEKYGLTPLRIILENETALTGAGGSEIRLRLAHILDTMCESVRRGLHASGVLPGPIRLERRAGEVYRKAMSAGMDDARFLVLLDSFSLAAAEENAAGHLVVTAPTSGSAGLMPGVVYFLREIRKVETGKLIDGMLIAALIAMIAKHNASISGAEVGCQGEIGVAAAMTAGFLAAVHGYPLEVIGSAAEIALEHHLGLSCDPVDGYVQIPCIERNAVGAVTAWNAYMIAAVSNPDKQKVSFDEVLEAMLQTGRCMSPAFKETSLGGLAVCTICG